MPLDNAQFISELSIVDPPGTDPLNQGDDHIRTTKRAVQQSFPNVDAAVPQTAAQMGQMAIKNEVNVFTQAGNTFQQRTDFNQNIRSELTNQDRGWEIRNSGLRVWQVYSASGAGTHNFQIRRYVADVLQDTPFEILNSTGQIRSLDGSASAPQYSFQNNTNMGMYRDGSNVLSFATVGARRGFFTAQQFRVESSRAEFPDGTQQLPAIVWTSSPTSGWFSLADGSARYSISGVQKFTLTGSGPGLLQDSPTGGTAVNFFTSAGILSWTIGFEGTAGFNPQSLTISRFNPATGAFLDNPFRIDSNRRIIMDVLPTSDPGIRGALYRTGTDVRVSV